MFTAVILSYYYSHFKLCVHLNLNEIKMHHDIISIWSCVSSYCKVHRCISFPLLVTPVGRHPERSWNAQGTLRSKDGSVLYLIKSKTTIVLAIDYCNFLRCNNKTTFLEHASRMIHVICLHCLPVYISITSILKLTEVNWTTIKSKTETQWDITILFVVFSLW